MNLDLKSVKKRILKMLGKDGKSSSETENHGKHLITAKSSMRILEAYRMARTNLLYSGKSEDGGVVFGVTSASPSDGKSLTCANLAISFAMSGKRVLLIDGDLRLPSVARKMDVPLTPGLSNVLVGAVALDAAVVESEVCANWNILPAGDIPPNPTELLGSGRMKKLIAALEESYDFIVIDLPPVNIVSDALVAAPVLDGMIVVVRENQTTRRALNNCTSQLALSNVKVLGFVMNDSTPSPGSYGRYKRYGRYGRYERNSYEKAAKKLRNREDD